MRKIDKLISSAIAANRYISVDNTTYCPLIDGGELKLHDNLIAIRTGDTWEISLQGWNTSTTRRRLSDCLGLSIVSRGGVPYCNGTPIASRGWYRIVNGAPIKVD